jgi:hypothetical protein
MILQLKIRKTGLSALFIKKRGHRIKTHMFQILKGLRLGEKEFAAG